MAIYKFKGVTNPDMEVIDKDSEEYKELKRLYNQYSKKHQQYYFRGTPQEHNLPF